MFRVLAALMLAFPLAAAAAVLPAGNPGGQCRAAIGAAERAFGIPAGLMGAIGLVESGRRGPDGRVDPWPWSIDANGEGRVFDTPEAAIAAVRALQAGGVRSIDVGCMQVNLLHHPDAFASLEAAFDPATNAAWAARFLVQLHAGTSSWPEAAALYHSATPALAAEYRRKVMAAWPAGLAQADDAAATAATAAPPFAGGLPSVGGLTSGGALRSRRLLRGPPLAPVQGGRALAAYRSAPVPLAIRMPGALRGRF